MNLKVRLSLLLFLPAIIVTTFLFSRTITGIIVYKRISTLNNAIITGNNGWLFYRGDLDYALLPWTSATKNLIRIDALAKKNGVKLCIVPVPNKIDLYPEFLNGNPALSPFLKKKTSRFFSHLHENNVTILDLYETFRNVQKTTPLYYPNETHTTTSGILLAVDETVRHFFPSCTDSYPGCIQHKTITLVGNLSRNKKNPPERLIDIHYNSCENTHTSGDTILVIGDSYCSFLAEYRASYPDLLEGRLGGRYAFRTHYKIDAGFKMGKIIASIIRNNPRIKTIIWVFSAREFYKALVIE